MARKLYIVLHIHKTAGKTLLLDFECNFKGPAWLLMYAGPIGLDKSTGLVIPGWETERINDYVVRNATSKTKCLFGHMVYFGIHNLVNADVKPCYITFLRDPVERCISLYYYLKNKSRTIWHKQIVEENWSIEEWFEKSRELRKYNGQLRHLLLGSYDEVLTEPELTKEHLEEGKRRLRQFWYVGLTETFHQDSHYLCGKLGFWRYHSQARSNVTPGKEEVSLATRQLIAERNALDIELYEFAKELRAEFMNREVLNFQFNKNKAILMRSLFSVCQPLQPARYRVYRAVHHRLKRLQQSR